MPQNVILGIPGALVIEPVYNTPATWRVGGSICLPQELVFQQTQSACLACSGPLSLVAQVSDSNASDAQCYLVLGCVRSSCGKKPGSWRAFSFAAPSEAPVSPLPHQSKPAGPSDPGSLAPAPSTEDWGVEDGGWGEDSFPSEPPASSSSRGAAQGGGLEDLATQLGSALKLGDREPAGAPKAGQNGGSAQAEPDVYRQVDLGSPVMPEFYLCQESEPGPPNDLKDAQQRHIAQLLKQYNLDNPQQEDIEVGPEGDKQAWSGEQYEVVAPKGVAEAFLKFSKRLARSPEQCLRLGGDVLWPCPEPQNPEEGCGRCGGQLEFRLQLMPPLMPMLEEAASWLEAETPTGFDWDWVTVAIFGCSGKCGSRAGVCEERVVLIDEQ